MYHPALSGIPGAIERWNNHRQISDFFERSFFRWLLRLAEAHSGLQLTIYHVPLN